MKNNISNKRRCPNCGVVTHKKGGLLGKKSIPITVEGKVYQGRCLTCDPLPAYVATPRGSASGQAAVVTAIVRPIRGREGGSVRRRRRSNDNDYLYNVDSGGNDGENHLQSNTGTGTGTGTSLPTAEVKPATPIRSSAERRSQEEQQQQRQQEQQKETHHDSEDNSKRRRDNGKRIIDDNNEARTRNATQLKNTQNKNQPMEGTQRNTKNTSGKITEAVPPLAPSMLPPSSRKNSLRRQDVPPATISTGVPKTLEVFRPGPSHTGSSSNLNSGDDYSVVSAITMDVHLFQSYSGRDNIFDEEYDDEKNDLVPPPTNPSRPGPENAIHRTTKRTSDSSNNLIINNNNNNHRTNTHGQFGRSSRRRSRRKDDSSDSGDDSPDSRHRDPRLPPDPSRDRFPMEDNGNELGVDTRYQQPRASDAAVISSNFEGNGLIVSTSSNEDTYFYDKKAVASTRRNTKEIDFRPDEKDFDTRWDNAPEIQQSLENTKSNNHEKNDNVEHQARNGYVHDIPTVENDDDFPSFIFDDYDYNDNYDHNQNVLRQQHQQQQQQQQQHHRQYQQYEQYQQYGNKNTVQEPPMTSVSSSSSSGPAHGNANLRRNSLFTSITKKDISDTQGILKCLNLEECNPDIREESLCKLFSILQSTSQSGDRELREFVLEHNVIEAATKSIWADMAIVEIQEAAMKLLLFIAASTTTIGGGDSDNQHGQGLGDSFTDRGNLLSKSESVCDSILFAMQNHAAEPGIQLKGCLIFASLAGSSSHNNNAVVNSDGSLSGAMTMILNAMSNHGGSRSIRKAGLQALHHQCLMSVHSENNKRTLLDSKLENGIAAIDVVIYAMEELQHDYVAMDWACQLCWCLTSSEVLLKQMEDSSLHEVILSVCQHYMTNPAGIGLVEASIGTIGNLANLETKRKELINIGAVELVIDGLRYHSNQFGICYEATYSMENFALPSKSGVPSSMVVKDDTVQMLVRGLKTYNDSPEYVTQGVRALACMASQSRLARELICVEEVIAIILDSIQQHTTPDVISTCSIFVATLASGESTTGSELMIEHGVMDLLFQAMEFSTEEKVHDSACLALRNLSCQIRESDMLLKDNKILRLLVSAMGLHRNSVSIQTSACCILSNLISKTENKELAFNPKVVPSITSAMQSHIESSDLLELACGALWELVDSFDDDQLFVGSEVVDVVACAMVMHPRTTPTLENACGLLSHLSSKQSLAETIANAQGVNIVAEAMCNNGSSISLLEVGCLTLKNIAIACPSFARDGSVAISTLISAMKENINCATFIKEACDLLWVLASEDENIRSKVLALDGISILMKCLEENSNNPEVETAALGAFNQLAKSNNETIA